MKTLINLLEGFYKNVRNDSTEYKKVLDNTPASKIDRVFLRKLISGMTCELQTTFIKDKKDPALEFRFLIYRKKSELYRTYTFRMPLMQSFLISYFLDNIDNNANEKYFSFITSISYKPERFCISMYVTEKNRPNISMDIYNIHLYIDINTVGSKIESLSLADSVNTYRYMNEVPVKSEDLVFIPVDSE